MKIEEIDRGRRSALCLLGTGGAAGLLFLLKKTSQFGFPGAVNDTVYADTAYYQKGSNPIGDDADQVFGDGTSSEMGGDGGGHEYQIAEISGSNSAGYSASLEAGV